MRPPEMYVWEPGRPKAGGQRSEVSKKVALAAYAFLAGIMAGYGWLYIHLQYAGR